ncbi:MAG TPA: hypothetical protein VGQ99_05055, partial [Tepidisphaeraceae bacterium]|nr:hypothetical protein [Tepidisphaeraceae bacterium]
MSFRMGWHGQRYSDAHASSAKSQIANRKSQILSASLRLCGCILLLLSLSAAPADQPDKPVGFQGLGPLLGIAPSLPPPPYKLKWTYKSDDADRAAI